MLAQAGFARKYAWGCGPHRFYFGYRENEGTWLKLDIVTDLCYGTPVRWLKVDANQFLQNRIRDERSLALRPEDEFITLLLHCLLDKGHFRGDHNERLSHLWLTSCRPLLLQHLRQFAPPIGEMDCEGAASAREWNSVLPKRQSVVLHLFRRDVVGSLGRLLGRIALRYLRPLERIARGRRLSIALLAPDGAGKSTLSERLRNDPRLGATVVYAGLYGNARSGFNKWLDRGIARNTLPWLTLPTKVLRSCARLLEHWKRLIAVTFYRITGKTVIFDRYLYDQWTSTRPDTLRSRIRRRVYEFGWPTPELIILLDAPSEVLYRRKQEHTREQLEQQRRAYLALRSRLPQMKVIDASQEAATVEREVITLIWEKYARIRQHDIAAGNA
jgi:thymidylate kinase